MQLASSQCLTLKSVLRNVGSQLSHLKAKWQMMRPTKWQEPHHRLNRTLKNTWPPQSCLRVAVGCCIDIDHNVATELNNYS